MISPSATITATQAQPSTTYPYYGLSPPISLRIDPATAVAQVVPIQAVPAQVLTVALGNQPCLIRLRAKQFWVPIHPPGTIVTDPPTEVEVQATFVDLYVGDVLVIGGCLARSGVGVVYDIYLDFVGEISIEDTQPDPVAGPSDPFYQGLGTRFLLAFWSNP